MTQGIIGRESELAAIERFLDAVTKAPTVLVIEGEAGIGKTTVWAEACRLAGDRGLRVLQARPTESEVRLSYAAVADLVGDVFDELQPLLPAVQSRALAAALLRADANGAADARTTATALLELLRRLGSQQPLLVAIDDVQWLDAASEDALAFAARRLPPGVALLLTRRTSGAEEPPLGLARALPDLLVERLIPTPLSLAGLHHLVTTRVGSSLPRPLLARLAEASGGNPFFALEIARAMAGQLGDRPAGEPLPVPRTLEELVAGRVHGLSDSAREAILVASALSQPTIASVAAALPDRDAAGAALVEAEEAGVLVTERDRLRFAHPLLASTIYGSAAPQRRRRLHEQLAAVTADAEERARHLALSATEPDEAVASELEQAADRAAKQGAQQAAAELFEAARRLTPGDRPDELARRQLGGASAALAAGDLGAARALAEDASGSPADTLRARALFLLGEIAWVGGSFRDADERYAQALAAAPDDDHELVGLASARLVYTNVAHDPARATELAEAAAQRLDPERSPAALASISIDEYWSRLLLGQPPRPELLERWHELEARSDPDTPKSTLPLIHAHSIDDFDGARARYAVEEEWYRVRGQDGWRAERQAHVSFAELRAGRWDEAERLVEESCAVIAQAERPGPLTMAFRFRGLVDACRGRTERARETLEPMIEEAERSGRTWWEALMLSALATVEFAAGDHRAVDRVLMRMHDCCQALGTRDMVPDRSEPFHVESLVALGETARAREVLERLEERGRVFPRLWIDATLPRTRALVLAGEGDVDGALAALDELDFETAAQLPFDLAWTHLVRGRLLRRARQKRAAADALGEAIEIFERLGAPDWLEQARSELDRVGLRRAPTELTATERRVAELAASGLTNREVAAEAFMSPKTVEANLARVYRKLGIRSRAELGARIEGERSPQT